MHEYRTRTARGRPEHALLGRAGGGGARATRQGMPSASRGPMWWFRLAHIRSPPTQCILVGRKVAGRERKDMIRGSERALAGRKFKEETSVVEGLKKGAAAVVCGLVAAWRWAGNLHVPNDVHVSVQQRMLVIAKRHGVEQVL